MDAVVWMTGNVGSGVEHRTVRDELSFASFRLACTPRVRRAGEWVDGETTWLGVTCSKALAENVRASIHKGDPVVVVGKLRTTRWEDAERGAQERLTIEAISVGHDLTRGVAQFQRTARPVVEDSVSVAELIVAAESQDPDQEPARTRAA
jgi:single-strand DNA-binding protein